jgi:dihydrofolate synthase/folylpolyglutamate synthase
VIQLASSIRDVLVNVDMSPTFFEFATVMAFSCFANEGVDWAVVETGMGGRLDATNVLLPDACVITNIGVEHTEFLGDSITEIAHEKAGIIKKATPVVTATVNRVALDVLKKSAEELGADIHVYGQDFFSTLTMMDDRGITFEYRDINHPGGCLAPFSEGKGFSMPVTGRYQMVNASLAIRVCEVLAQRERPFYGAVIQDGLSGLGIEGRLEYISRSPLIILDSAHNPEAVRSLSDSLSELFPGKKFIVITGLMKDKDIKGFLSPLISLADTIDHTDETKG